MSDCFDCKRPFDEIDLTWTPQRDTLILLCGECDNKGERERKDSPKKLGPRNDSYKAAP